MNDILGIIRSAIDLYGMIDDGDVVAVGCSGGKDSTLLLLSMNALSKFYPKKFRVIGITVDIGAGADYSPIKQLCSANGIEYHVKKTRISDIVFKARKEQNPCSLCSKMRRGALNNFAAELNANKIALAHHRDDVVETFMLNLIHEGRLGCFQPVTYLSRKNLTVIRPFIFLDEQTIIDTVERLKIPVVKNPCPADGNTQRQAMKDLVKDLEKVYPGVAKRIYGAVKRSDICGWKITEE